MLKLIFVYKNKNNFKNSKALIYSLYKRYYLLKILIFKRYCFNNFKHINMRFINKANILPLIRSPFHYKNSKILIGSNFLKMRIEFDLIDVCETAILFNTNFLNLVHNINKNDVILLQKIIIKQKKKNNVKIKTL